MRRVLPLLIAAAVGAAPVAALAGVHMHLPKKHHRRDGAADPPPPANTPGSDIPDAAWATGSTRR